MAFQRITFNANKMGGAPCLRNTRIPVATVIGMISNRMTTEEILAHYPDLQKEDIDESLRFAAEAVRERQIPLISAD